MVKSLRQVAEAPPRLPAFHMLSQAMASNTTVNYLELPKQEASFGHAHRLARLLGTHDQG